MRLGLVDGSQSGASRVSLKISGDFDDTAHAPRWLIGLDVSAACGTPLVAARGGRIRWRASQSTAGNYLVIDGAGTSLDTGYMPLTAPALVIDPLGYLRAWDRVS